MTVAAVATQLSLIRQTFHARGTSGDCPHDHRSAWSAHSCVLRHGRALERMGAGATDRYIVERWTVGEEVRERRVTVV